MMRLAVVTPIPTPYRDPFWNVVAGHPDVDGLDVYYCAKGKADRPWTANWEMEYRAVFLPGHNLLKWRGQDASCFWNPGIRRELRAGRYDAILIGGYNHLTMLAAVREAIRLGVPYYLMSETWSMRRTSVMKRLVKDPLVRWVVRNAVGTLPTGMLAERYLLMYGANPDTIVRVPNVPDIDRFAQMRASEPPAELKRYGDRPVILFAARLIPKKRPQLLLQALHRSCGEHDAVLVIVGDGPLRAELQQTARALGINDRVHFAGFVEPDEMPRWYANAHVFVLPSSETWGVAVIESLASGTPVIVSDEVGCHPDVVVDAGCGDVVPAANEHELATAIQRRCGNDSPESTFAQFDSEAQTQFSYVRLADDLLSEIQRDPTIGSTVDRTPEQCVES